MAVASLPMLDFSKLQTPADHGRVLVSPLPGHLAVAARANHGLLDSANVALLDSTLAACRQRVREAVVGHNDRLVVVTGHDPAFAHPGVWAKHIVAVRLAGAVNGIAANLVVDSAAPKRTSIPVPSVSGDQIVLTAVPYARIHAGAAFEQIQRLSLEEIAAWQRDVQRAMGDRFDASQMPTFCQGLRAAERARDWVDQVVTARKAVEAELGITINDYRVSRVWASPLLLDMLLQAERFAASYNRALSAYRKSYRVRGAQRPIPDLHCVGGRCEAAVWIYRRDEPRQRLFVMRAGSTLRLFAHDREIASIAVQRISSCNDIDALQAELGEWRLRPRALTLTLWARLLLADLFIHGIGGAKYDRITDAIIADYYGLVPPTMACVSATLHLGLPHPPMTTEGIRKLRRSLRDLHCNPQRHFSPAPDLDALLTRRGELVRRGTELSQTSPADHVARRAVFDQIRQINAELLQMRPDALPTRQSELTGAVEALKQTRAACGREYFFGLYDRPTLTRLLNALPQQHEFKV